MNCMKCGRETPDEQVFCQVCLGDMSHYPVKPNIAVQLPHRREVPISKRAVPAKRRQDPQDVIRNLRKRIRTLVILWLITLLLLAATIYPAVQYIISTYVELPGQNYSTFTQTDPTEP